MLLLLSVLLSVASPSNLFDSNDGNSNIPNGNTPPKKQTRIIGGTPLQPTQFYNKYPFMASLQWGTHRCGGTLIASDLLVTAAHCAFVRWEVEAGVERLVFLIVEREMHF